MKVALSHDWLTGMRGGEKVLEEVCLLFPDSEIYTLIHKKGALSETIESRPVHTSFLQFVPGILGRYKHFLPLFPVAIESFNLKGDLVISTSHCVAKSVRPPRGAKHVSYCHTPMRYAWLFFDEYFGSYPGWAKRLLAPLLAALRAWDAATASRVTHFVANSRNVQNRIREFYKRDASVIYPPVDTDFYSPSQAAREDFYLIVSALVPYKRVDLAVRAFNELGLNLVVIGEGPSKKALERAAGPTVKFTGAADNETLRRCYRKARALIFPGEEDFGIVPVEAQACGAPVIAYAKGGALETVLEGRTGLFFSEQTVGSLKEAVLASRKITFDPAEARANAERFSRERFRREFYDEVMKVLRGSNADPLRGSNANPVGNLHG